MNITIRDLKILIEYIKYPINFNPTFKRNTIPLNEDPATPFYKCDFPEIIPNEYFSWEYVYECPIYPNYRGRIKPCSECLKEANEKLKRELTNKGIKRLKANYITIHFRSPEKWWEGLAGSEGYLTICLKHKKQIDWRCFRFN